MGKEEQRKKAIRRQKNKMIRQMPGHKLTFTDKDEKK